ncbi:MAG: hypothetical protein ACXADW_14030 [Candidatus Hodarchaeales archaeon]|jgi:hypothetical protein
MAKVEKFVGKEKMLSDWNRVLVSILRANAGECDIKHVRNKKEEVVGIVAELLLQFETAIAPNVINNYEKAVKVAKSQLGDLVTKEGEFTSKQRMLIDWMSMKNAIVRAESGEMKIALRKAKSLGAAGAIVGIVVELVLNFGGSLEEVFTEEEKSAIDEAQNAQLVKE